MPTITPINLALLPAPDVVETLDYESIFSQLRTELIGLDASLADTLSLESEPLTKVLQLLAYRELTLRQRINEAALATMLAYASDADLDQRGGNYNVERLVITPADDSTTPPTPAVYESDDDFRVRIQLSLDGLSTAGAVRGYQFHALSADAQVLDASVDAPTFALATLTSAQAAVLPSNAIVIQPVHTAGLDNPIPGDVVITVLSHTGDGSASTELLATVNAALSADDVRPLTDRVNVRSADIITIAIEATIFTYDGHTDLVLENARENLDLYLAANKRLGHDITESGLHAALHVAGVQRVELISPVGNVVCDDSQAAAIDSITLHHGGVDR